MDVVARNQAGNNMPDDFQLPILRIGQFEFSAPAVLAPMAGVSDKPFRQLCRYFGAAYCIGEMIGADPRYWHSEKSILRRDHDGEFSPKVIQLLGNDSKVMAEAAKKHYQLGADIIDINMGCPAKKVCKKAAGSQLLANEGLVKEILEAVVAAVPVPVTLKMRTGINRDHKNGVLIAKIAEDSGICAITVHGRTRQCHYKDPVEYATITAIKSTVDIPIIANGDIQTPEKAYAVLRETGANAVMIGRGAHGRPWLFRQINDYFIKGELTPTPTITEIEAIVLHHFEALYRFYGEHKGVRFARKHMAWYLNSIVLDESKRKTFLSGFNQLDSQQAQCAGAREFFKRVINAKEMAA